MSDAPPWSQSEPQICLSLTKYKKDTTNPEVYKPAFLKETSRHQTYVHIFTDGSKVDEKVAAAAVSSVASYSPFSCRLRDHGSIYTAELQASLFAFTPQWGAADAEIKVPSGENTELKRSPFKAWSRSVYSHTCYVYCQGFLSFLLISTLPVHSPAFFPKPLPIFPCVGCG